MRRKVVVSLTTLALIALVAVLGRASGQRAGWQPSATPAGESEAAETPGSLSGELLSGDDTLSRAELLRAANQAEDVPSAGGSWEYAGANNIGGRVTDVVVDPTHPNTIFVASAGGGVWKSTDAGLTYTPAWPNDYPQAIGSLARGSDGTLWAGTGEANASGGGITYVGDGVYKSTDNGVTWTNVGLGNAGMIGRIAVDPTEPGPRPRRGGGRRSTRPAASAASTGRWTAATTGRRSSRPISRRRRSPGVVDVAIDPVNPNRVYAIQWDHHRTSYLRPYGGIGSGLYVTDNAMEVPASNVTWERIDNSHVSGPLPTYDASGSGLDRLRSDTLGRMGVAIAPVRPHARLPDHRRVARQRQGLLRLRQRRPLARRRRPDLRDQRPRRRQPALRVVVRPAVRRPGEQGPSVQDGRQPARVERTAARRGRTSAGRTPTSTAWRGTRTSRTASTSATTAACTAPTRTANSGWIHGTNMPWLQEYHVAVSQTRPNRIAIGLQDNGSNRSWTNVNDAVADPVAANWSSYGGGDGHYVVIDSQDDTYYYSCSQNAGCSGVHDQRVHDDDALRSDRGRRDERQARERHEPRRRRDADDRADGREPGDGHDHDRRHRGRRRHRASAFTPALAFAHASGATVVEERRAEHAEPQLRLTRQRPALHDGRAARPGSDRLGDALPRLQQPVAVDEPRSELDADRCARPAHRPVAAGRLVDEQPALRGPVRRPISTIGVGKSRPEHDLRRHRQRPAVEDDGPRHDLAGVPEPVRPRPGALGDLGDRRPGGRDARIRLVRRLPRGLHVGERVRDDVVGDGSSSVMTWKNVSGNLPNAPVNFLAYDRSNDTIYAATDLGVFFMQGDTKDWIEARRQPAEHGDRGRQDPGELRQALRGHLRPRHVADPARGGHSALQPAGRQRPGRRSRTRSAGWASRPA